MLLHQRTSSKCSLVVSASSKIWKEKSLHSDGRHVILLVLLVHEIDIDILTSSLGLVLLLSVLSHVAFDTGSDSKLGGSLTDLGKISTRESGSVFGEEIEVDTGSERRLSESSRKNRKSRCLVWKRDVDELNVSKANGNGNRQRLTWSNRPGRSKALSIWSGRSDGQREGSSTITKSHTGSTNDEDVLLGVHTIHLGLHESARREGTSQNTHKDLVENSITGSTTITTTSTS